MKSKLPLPRKTNKYVLITFATKSVFKNEIIEVIEIGVLHCCKIFSSLFKNSSFASCHHFKLLVPFGNLKPFSSRNFFISSICFFVSPFFTYYIIKFTKVIFI